MHDAASQRLIAVLSLESRSQNSCRNDMSLPDFLCKSAFNTSMHLASSAGPIIQLSCGDESPYYISPYLKLFPFCFPSFYRLLTSFPDKTSPSQRPPLPRLANRFPNPHAHSPTKYVGVATAFPSARSPYVRRDKFRSPLKYRPPLMNISRIRFYHSDNSCPR